MQYLKDIPIRTKFVLFPLIGSGFLIATLILYATHLNSERQALAHTEQENLAKVGVLSDLFAQLSRNHVRIFTMLSSTAEFLDEEAIYENGKKTLYLIYELEKKISQLTRQFTLKTQEEEHLSTLIV
ncbi:MAG: hypothetical protein V3T60_03880, partial [Candidatus Binatia bacterium]